MITARIFENSHDAGLVVEALDMKLLARRRGARSFQVGIKEAMFCINDEVHPKLYLEVALKVETDNLRQ
jgi:hypothetical protein